MQIKEIKISEIKLYEKNNKIHKKEQIELLKKTITEFGFTNPVLLSDKNECIGGHGRIQAMQELGKGEIPAVYIKDLTPAQVRKLRLLDNKIAELAEDNLEAIKFELEELEDQELNELYDLDIETLDPDKEAIEDDVPEVSDNIIVEKGDIFQLGEHRLMCGDSTSIDDVEKLMDGEKADMVFTDPPYGVSYSNNMNDKFDVIKNDDVFLDIMPVLNVFSKENIHWYIWTSQQVYNTWRDMFETNYKNTIIWYKGGGGLGDLKGDYALNYEMCLFCHFGRKDLEGKREGAVWEIGKDNGSDYVHPTQKPVGLSQYAITKSLKKNEKNVLDLFAGSGSTLIGCEKMHKKGYMCELDEKYVQVILKRYNTYTEGKQEIKCINRTLDLTPIYE